MKRNGKEGEKEIRQQREERVRKENMKKENKE
jgi:hypothetical protein